MTEPTTPFDTWNPCILSCSEPERGEHGQQTIQITDCWHDGTLTTFCLKNNISTRKLLQTIWALVLGTYTNSDEPCSRFFSSANPEIELVYGCRLNKEESIFSVAQSIVEQEFKYLGTSNDGNSAKTFNTKLSITFEGHSPASFDQLGEASTQPANFFLASWSNVRLGPRSPCDCGQDNNLYTLPGILDLERTRNQHRRVFSKGHP